MIRFLLKKYVPDCDRVEDPAVRERYGIFSGSVGIILNLSLFAGKLLAGLLSSSISIISDAFNNLSDAGSSIITLIGFRISGEKPDADHPFGHGRVEYITGLIVSIIICMMGVELGRESFAKILHPSPVSFSPLIGGILAASIAVKLYMYSYNRAFAKKLGSVALSSTASDSRNDSIATTAVLAAQLVYYFTSRSASGSGINLDGISGLAVAAFILYSGITSVIDTINPLLGQEPDPELVSGINAVVTGTHPILGMHDLVIHDYGPGRRMVSLHAEVPSDMTLVAAHELIDGLEQRLNAQFHMETVIHIDPVDRDDRLTQQLREKLIEFLDYLSPDFLFHDFRIVKGESHTRILFDVNVPFGTRMTDEEIVRYLRDRFHQLDAAYRVIVSVDHYKK